MIKDKLVKLKQAHTIAGDHGLPEMPANTEFHIVNDMVYMNGHPLPPTIEPVFYKWIEENPSLFTLMAR
jgi:hypothetical protein